MRRRAYQEVGQPTHLGHWRLGEVVDGRRFDVGRRWLPTPLSAARDVECLSAAEMLRLSHLEMGAYAHLFGCLEACVGAGHAGFFRDVLDRVDAALGFAPARLPAALHVASVLRGKHPAAVLVLTTAIEALAQQHYLACFEEDASLDPFAWDVLRSHWLEESRRPRLARLDAADVFQRLGPVSADGAIDDFIEILAGLDGVLHIQAHLDLETLLRHVRRDPSPAAQTEVLGAARGEAPRLPRVWPRPRERPRSAGSGGDGRPAGARRRGRARSPGAAGLASMGPRSHCCS